MYNIDSLPKDILIEIAIELDLSDIVNWCQLNKRINSLTGQNETFWMRKFIHDYGNNPKNSDLTWKEFYKLVTVTNPNDLLWKGVEENILSYVAIGLIRGADIENTRSFNHHDYNPLSKASENGHLEVVKYLVEQGADVCARYNYPLINASDNGHLDVVKYLVEQGADVRARDNYALRWAGYNGYLEVVKYLVEHGANVRADNDFALRIASENGHLEVVKFLVKQGVNVRVEDDYALISASENGHLEVVKYLVEQGADVHAEYDYALRLARHYEHFDIVDYLESLS